MNAYFDRRKTMSLSAQTHLMLLLKSERVSFVYTYCPHYHQNDLPLKRKGNNCCFLPEVNSSFEMWGYFI